MVYNMQNIYIKIGLTVLSVIAGINYSYSQQKEEFHFDHRAVYAVTYLSDSLDQQSQKQQMTELLMNDETSLFRSLLKAEKDSSYQAYLQTKVITMSAPTVSPMGEINAFNYQIVKDLKSGQTKVYDEYMGANLNNLTEINYYLEPKESLHNWILKDDTTTINGQLCQRADIEFGGRKWTAWFAQELSTYPVGPYKFSGLPGLIFRVYDQKKTWNFELLDLSAVDTLVPINFKEGLNFKETTKEQLYKDRRYYQKNQLEIKEAAGAKFGDSRAEIKKKLEAYIVRDNNWIELL